MAGRGGRSGTSGCTEAQSPDRHWTHWRFYLLQLEVEFKTGKSQVQDGGID